jgi:5-carboxymethyl-2-hydroxymuconate isomerase
MSHMTLEYSANLRPAGRFGDLCRKLAQFMTGLTVDGQPVFPTAGVRVRAIPCEDYCIADGSVQDAGFVHAILKIGAGRSDAAKQATRTGLFEIMKEHFAAQYARQGMALSLEFIEFSESGTLKHNNLHARFKRAAVRANPGSSESA